MDKEHGRSKLNFATPAAEPDQSVNSKQPVQGALVLKEVVQLTGLPEHYLDSEISQLLGTAADSVNDLTLEQLRLVLLNYLETVNEEMTEDLDRH